MRVGARECVGKAFLSSWDVDKRKFFLLLFSLRGGLRCAWGVLGVCLGCAWGVLGCAWVCLGVLGCAWGVLGCAWVCLGVLGCARVCLDCGVIAKNGKFFLRASRGMCIVAAWDLISFLVWRRNGTFNTTFLYEITLFFVRGFEFNMPACLSELPKRKFI